MESLPTCVYTCFCKRSMHLLALFTPTRETFWGTSCVPMCHQGSGKGGSFLGCAIQGTSGKPQLHVPCHILSSSAQLILLVHWSVCVLSTSGYICRGQWLSGSSCSYGARKKGAPARAVWCDWMPAGAFSPEKFSARFISSFSSSSQRERICGFLF